MVGNLALLGAFKYLGFFTQTVDYCISSFDPRILSCTSRRYIVLHLPDDVSIRYDVYRGKP